MMQVDLRLRAHARAVFEQARLWVDQPSFEEAERLRLPSYHAAVGVALEDRSVEMELNSSVMQLVMPI